MTIDNYAPHTGRFLKEDDTAVNMADILAGTGTKTATFALNGTQSNAIDLEGYQLAALIMPAAWTASSGITFLASDTIDGTYGPVYDDTGTEVKVTAATGGAAGTRIPIVQNALALASLRFIKLRSGIAGTEVAQTAARTITLSLKR